MIPGLGLLKAIPLRWWIYIAGATAIAGVLWHDHHQTHRANRLAIEKAQALDERDQARATIETMKVDLALNKETSHALAERLAAIERDRRDHPIVGLRCLTAAAIVSAESGAAAGTDAADPGRESEEATFDPSAGLTDYGTDCAAIAGRLTTLQEWERARAH